MHTEFKQHKEKEEGFAKLAGSLYLAEQVSLVLDGKAESFSLPAALKELIYEALLNLEQGNAVELVALRPILSSQEAAEFLHVSRKFLICEILDKGKIPFTLVGKHRRIKYSDLLEYKRKLKVEQTKNLDELAIESQQNGFFYV